MRNNKNNEKKVGEKENKFLIIKYITKWKKEKKDKLLR